MPRSSAVRETDVAVVGGGITGLLVAYHLSRHGKLDVALVEASPRVGGKVWTGEVGELVVERGPDAFLTRGSNLAAVCRDLGLGADLVAPAVARAAIWARGRPRLLPSGLALGVPSRPLALATSGLLSPAAALRAGLDLVLPRSPVDSSTTVADALERRFGREVRERLVDPLLGGIYAGDTRRLGLLDALPDLYAAASRSRSLLLALRGRPRPAGPVFQSLRGGLQALTDALAARLPDVRLGAQVTGIVPSTVGFELAVDGGALRARAVVLTTPAFTAADILRPIEPELSDLLRGIGYAGVATVALAYPRGALRPTGTSGFLVPPREGRLVTAVTWVSEKWPHSGDDRVGIVRCSTGRAADDRWRGISDALLVDRVREELAELTGLRAEPLAAQVTRWEAGLPQYEAGHSARVAAVESGLRRHPGLLVAGAAYHGVGLAACGTQAERVAEAAAAHCLAAGAG